MERLVFSILKTAISPKDGLFVTFPVESVLGNQFWVDLFSNASSWKLVVTFPKAHVLVKLVVSLLLYLRTDWLSILNEYFSHSVFDCQASSRSTYKRDSGPIVIELHFYSPFSRPAFSKKEKLFLKLRAYVMISAFFPFPLIFSFVSCKIMRKSRYWRNTLNLTMIWRSYKMRVVFFTF